jgi:hypothetical protein
MRSSDGTEEGGGRWDSDFVNADEQWKYWKVNIPVKNSRTSGSVEGEE